MIMKAIPFGSGRSPWFMVSEQFSEKFCRVALLDQLLYFRPMGRVLSGQLFRESCLHLRC